MKVTRSDVAKRAGVSTATVSNVLNGSGKVKEETAKRVLAVVKELEYHPDMIARSLSTKESMQLGIVLEDVSNPFFGEIVKGFESAANEKNYFVNVCTSFNKMDAYFDNFITRRLDGIFVTALPHKFQVDKLYDLIDRGIKIVNSGNENADFKKIASIENNYLKAMDEAMEHLYKLGHRDIAYLSGLGKSGSFDLRCVGYLNMVERLKLPCGEDLLIDGEYPYATSVTAGYNESKKLLSMGKKFTAIICTNDLMAIGAMRALREMGIRIPEDVSVMGFDGVELAKYTQPSLTTMAMDQHEFGRKAFELLYTYIKQDMVGYYKNNLKLIKRESTGLCKV